MQIIRWDLRQKNCEDGMEMGFEYVPCLCYVMNFFPQRHSSSVFGLSIIRIPKFKTERQMFVLQYHHLICPNTMPDVFLE